MACPSHMATAVSPLHMMSSHHRVNLKSLPPPPTSSPSFQEPSASSTTPDVLESTGKPFKRLRSSLEQTLRTATRSKIKPTSQPADEFATPKGNPDKGKGKQSSEDVEQKDKEKLKGLKRFESKVGLRSRKDSVTPASSSALSPITRKTEDGGNNVNMKIHEGEKVRAGGSTGFITPTLRQASMSSPALHLASQAIPSPKSQSAVPASSNSNTSILVSPTRDKTRRPTLQAPKEISGPIPLSPKRDVRNSNGHTNSTNSKEPRTPTKSPTLPASSPALASSSQVSSQVTPPRRGRERPRTPDTPTPTQHKRTTASTSNAILNTPSTSPIPGTGSPIRTRSPSTRVTPSQRGLTSISTSNLPLNSPNSSLTPRRPSIDTKRRPSADHQHRPSGSASPQPASPSSPVRPRAERTNSPAYAQNRHFNVSSTSLAPTSTPEQREIIRSATAILCKEMRKPPPHLSGTQSGMREWEEVEVRMQPLIRLERIWGRSGGTLGGSSTQLNSGVGGMLSTGGEDRERRVFCQALRDGFVLCQLMNKFRPGTISRPDPRDDGFIRTSNVTKFLASCSAQGVLFEDLFHRDDLIETTPESLARVARTVISVVKIVGTPTADRSKILTGQGKKTGGTSETSSSPYGYGTSSRAASSVPNLSGQRTTSPAPKGRKRWTPPSPTLPTLRSVSPSELGSGTSSSKTSPNANTKGGRVTPVHDGSKDISPSALVSQSPSQTQPESMTVTTHGDPSSSPQLDSISVSIAEQPIPSSVARQSMASSDITDATGYSSLLDRYHSNNGNKFGTIRTVTTEATSFAPSDIPSYTRTEASFVASSLSDEMAWKRGVRERKPSEAAIVDLSRVTEERPDDTSSPKAGRTLDNGVGMDMPSGYKPESPEKVHLGKGKWPEDFLDIFQDPNRTQPIPIKRISPDREASPMRHSPISISSPRKVSYISASRRNDNLDSIPPIPRRPTHRARHSVEPVLLPKEAVLRRDVNPDAIVPAGPRIVLRRQSTKTGVQRTGAYLPRSNHDSLSNEEVEPLVPFPRTTSGENSPVPSSDGAPGTGNSGNDRPRQLRGRFQSEIEGMSARRRARPTSYDDMANKPRQMRFESMINLGAVSSNASASDILSRDSIDGNAVRRTLIVREEGKPPTHFQLGNCIGRGQFGSVYRALNLNTGQTVAVKRIGLEGLKEEEVMQLMREVDLVKRLSHPSIVKYEGMARDEDTLSIVLEYVENGSLGQTLKAFGKLNEGLVASYVVKILEGLHYLHQSDVVHCDLKAANILTTKNGNVKLSDFGVSLNLRAMEREMKDVAGTPNWMAPEVIELKGASTKSDIWSLGCTVIELLTGRPPYAEIPNSMSVMFRIVEDDMPPLPEGCSPLLRDFLKQCFNKEPKWRPSAEILCEHEWLKKSWSELKDLRPQDSIPFLRRVSSDFQKSEALQFLAQIDTQPSEPALLDNDHSMTSVTPISRRFSNGPGSSRAGLDDTMLPMSPRDHSFVKTTFSKPMVCRVCLLNVKKSAVLCETCSLISHSKCAINAPPTCDLRAQLLLYAQYAETGNPGSAYSNTVDILKGGGSHVPTSPISEVANVAPSPSSRMTDDYPPTQEQSPQGTPDRPPTAFRFMTAFKSKRSKASLTAEPEQGSSSTSLLPSNAPIDIPSPKDVYQHREKTIPKKPSLLKRNRDLRQQRPQSQSSDSTGPNTASMRSAAESLSSRLEHGRRFTTDIDTGTQSRFTGGGEFEATRLSKTPSLSGASAVPERNWIPSIPGSMPDDNPRHRRQDSKPSSNNCSIQ